MPGKPIRVRCPLGGLAPCVDDMCHSGGDTLCGLEVGEHEDADVCWHGYLPDTCDQGCADDRDDYDDWQPDEPGGSERHDGE